MAGVSCDYESDSSDVLFREGHFMQLDVAVESDLDVPKQDKDDIDSDVSLSDDEEAIELPTELSTSKRGVTTPTKLKSSVLLRNRDPFTL